MKIIIESWKQLIIHEILTQIRLLDYTDNCKHKIYRGGILTLFWAGGVGFHFATFPDTEAIFQEKLNGRIHYSSLTFALKEKFVKQVIREEGTVNFTDVSHNEIFSKLTEKLKSKSKFRNLH